MKQTLKDIHNHPGIKKKISKLNKGNQPPKKNIVIKDDIIKIFEYSAKKNNTKVVAAYSTLYPDTSSDSASGRSNGTRLVSANAAIKNNNKLGHNGKKKS